MRIDVNWSTECIALNESEEMEHFRLIFCFSNTNFEEGKEKMQQMD
jgi:hypothetical protein